MIEVVALLIMVLLLAAVSLKITKDFLNPALLAALGVFVNFTLNRYPLTELQETPLTEAYNAFYWGGLITLVVLPIMLMFVFRKNIAYKNVLSIEKYNEFGFSQWSVASAYLFLYLLHNYILSGSLFPLLSAAKDIHHMRIPVLDSIIVPACGVLVFFEGVCFNTRKRSFLRAAIFILAPISSGSRLIPAFMFGFFLVGYLGARGRMTYKHIGKLGTVVAGAFFLLFFIGAYRSGTRGLELGYGEVWGIQLFGLPLADDFAAFYWRYFITTFANFNELTAQVVPVDRLLDLWVYPLAQFMQLDNLLGMPSIINTLARDFGKPLADVPSIVSFFGPIYLYGGVFWGFLWCLVYGLSATLIYIKARNNILFAMLYAPFAVSFMLGSFVNMFLSGTVVAYVFSLMLAVHFYRMKGILIVRKIHA